MANHAKQLTFMGGRLTVCALCFVLCIALLAGCSGASDNNETAGSQTSSSAVNEEVAVGEPMTVQTGKGDLEITVDGFETSADMRERFSSFETIKKGKTIGMLLLKVKNVSYEDEINEGYVMLGSDVYPIDAEGVSLDSLSMVYDYGEYSGAAGADFECGVGQAKREALFYVVDDDITEITISVAGTEIPVDVKAV